MIPKPIDYKRIEQLPSIKSYVIDKSKTSLTGLLKDGRVFKLLHSGCEHSGATVSLWLETEYSLSEVDPWLKQIHELVRVAFSPDIANDITRNIKEKKFRKELTEERIFLSGAPAGFMSYEIVISEIEHGQILTISYILG